jgi:hypothetical protein
MSPPDGNGPSEAPLSRRTMLRGRPEDQRTVMESHEASGIGLTRSLVTPQSPSTPRSNVAKPQQLSAGFRSHRPSVRFWPALVLGLRHSSVR